MSIFDINNKNSHLNKKMFFDESVDIARYDKVKYPQFEKLTNQSLSFFWRPEEIVLTKDSKDFKQLDAHEKHIFVSNLKRQIILDSVQGRAPSIAFLPICSLPEIENFIQTWSFFETIHSRSYTHIIRNIYSDPSIVFDEMLDIQELLDCAVDISKYYDDLIKFNEGPDKNSYQHKKALWLCLNAVNALEGIRFYGSFACSWNFAELKKMEGNAKIIKFIARDENIHLAASQQFLKLLPKDDDDFARIKEETVDETIQIFNDVINQDKIWGSYLFQHGSMIGLNEKIYCDYIEFIGKKRMSALGLNSNYVGADLRWTHPWISGSSVQSAPQEVEIESYTIGEISMDVDSNTFSGFSL